MIPPETIANVMDAAQIEEVVSEFVVLKKRGSNMLGLCPFHNEKTPSFTVSPAKGIFKCFGCGRAGNSAKFLMEHEQFTYPESIRFLAKKYQIEIAEVDNEEVREKRNLLDSLFILNQFAQSHFTENLLQSDEGKSIGLSYFKERGYREHTIDKFQLGYSINSFQSLLDRAKAEDYDVGLLERLGLIKTKDERSYDFFRGRVMFPIHNQSGKVIAFAGRTLSTDKKVPKYVNSPESDIYIKNKILYGIYFARKSIRDKDKCYLTEGYTDVITMHQSGIENVVASSGTSLTQGQIRLVKRYTRNISIIFDGDEAGIKAALRGVDLILEEDMNVKVVLLPDGEDPDSFVKKNGLSGFEEYIEKQEKDFIFFKTDLLLKEAGDDPIRKTELVNSIVESLAKIPDPIKRSIYVKECSRLLDISERIIVTETNKKKRQQIKRFVKEKDRDSIDQLLPETKESVDDSQRTNLIQDNIELLEREVIRLLLLYGDKNLETEVFVTPYILQELKDSKIELKNPLYRQFLSLWDEGIEQNELYNSDFFVNHIDEDVSQKAIHLITPQYELSNNWEEMHNILITKESMNFQKEVFNLLNRFKLRHILSLISENQEKIKTAENGEEERKHLELHARLIKLQTELAKLLGTFIIR